MRAKQNDNNQQEIMHAFRVLGCKVFDTHTLGGGFPDLVLAYRGAIHLVEVKAIGGKLTPAEMDFCTNYPVRIVRTVDDVRELVEEWSCDD